MALSEFEVKRCDMAFETFMKQRRPSIEVRSELDLGWKLENQSIEIFEIRPQWNDASIIRHHSFAKATYVKSQKIWKIYWMRSTLKWEAYEPYALAKTIEEVLEVVNKDDYNCFFG